MGNKALKAYFNSRPSNRLLSAFIALFFIAQFIGALHGAAYGTGAHEHDGQPCIIATTIKHIETIDTPTLVALPAEPDFLVLAPTHTKIQTHDITVQSLFHIRAPPTFTF